MPDSPAPQRTVLIVDDEDVIRDLIADVVSDRGYRVLTAASGKEAIEIVKAEKKAVNLVILDMLMPDLDGRQTYERMKQIVPDLHVLVATGFGREDVARGLMELGIRGVVSKPFHIEDLMTLIDSHVGS